MATPPTFDAEYEVADWLVSTTPRTVTPTTAAGDKLVIAAITADQLTQLTSPPTGNSLTYTLAQSITVASSCQVYGWTAPDDTGGAGWTLSISETGTGAPPWGFTALRFSGSDGFGASAKTGPTSGAPSLDITTTADNSAIVVMVGDWAAVDGATRTWRTVNGTTPTAGNGFERSYARSAVDYTIYVAYYPDAGAAGVKTVGLSAPGAQTYSIIAVEVKGTAAAAVAGGVAPTYTNPLQRLPYTLERVRVPSPPIPMLLWAGGPAAVTALEVAVDPAILVLSGVDATLAGTGDSATAVDPATLILSGVDPTAAGSGAASVAADPAVLTLTGVTPDAAGTGAASVAVDSAVLVLTGVEVEASAGGLSVAVDSAILTLTGIDATLTATGAAPITVDAATLSLVGLTPTLAGTGVGSVAVDSATLLLAGVDPVLAGSGQATVVVDSAVLTLVGQDVVVAGTEPDANPITLTIHVRGNTGTVRAGRSTGTAQASTSATVREQH